MKANKKNKLEKNDDAFVKVVGGLVALLIMIIVGILVYWETSDNIAESSTTETFTSDSDDNTFTRYDRTTGSNLTGERVELKNTPSSITSVYVWNGSGNGAAEACTVTTHYTNTDKYIDIVADSRGNFTQVNVTYVSNLGSGVDTADDMTSTVFDLIPIIGLAVVASIIVGVIINFGSGSKRF